MLTIGGVHQVSEYWACLYNMPVIHTKQRQIHGVDPIYALTLCLGHIRRLIDSAAADENIEIWWLERGDHGGF